MVIVGVILYLAAVSAALVLLGLPGVRRRLAAALQTRSQRTQAAAGQAWRRAARRGQQGVQAGLSPLAQAGADAGNTLRRHRWPLLLAAALLLLAPAAALLLRQWHAYDGFDHTWRSESNPQIAELLRGEQLVPPQKLPPELFTTREVLQERPLAASASRQWELLDAEFRQRLLLAFKLMREQHGVEMVLIEGYRSPERQAQLLGLGDKVTHAGPGQSYHQFGLAADCAFLIDGRIVISERDPRAASAYAAYGSVAQSLRLTWGGAWRSLKDLGHVELQRAGALQARMPGSAP